MKRARAAGIIAADADTGAAAAEAAAEHRAQRRARNKVKKREPLWFLPIKTMTSNVKFRGSYQKNDPN